MFWQWYKRGSPDLEISTRLLLCIGRTSIFPVGSSLQCFLAIIPASFLLSVWSKRKKEKEKEKKYKETVREAPETRKEEKQTNELSEEEAWTWRVVLSSQTKEKHTTNVGERYVTQFKFFSWENKSCQTLGRSFQEEVRSAKKPTSETAMPIRLGRSWKKLGETAFKSSSYGCCCYWSKFLR